VNIVVRTKVVSSGDVRFACGLRCLSCRFLCKSAARGQPSLGGTSCRVPSILYFVPFPWSR